MSCILKTDVYFITVTPTLIVFKIYFRTICTYTHGSKNVFYSVYDYYIILVINGSVVNASKFLEV